MKDSKSNSLGSSGFGPDVTKSDTLASGKMPGDKQGNANDVIPPKSRTSDSVQADYNAHCDSSDCCS